ncbi:hypothetical protein M407DRAFT_17844 [Tulasnella calospora MUT 4182]|uniref:DUF6534 domain-containing protein n=1 Tax=Tulasnella calospora MUT 4182 TaxID=1051891 RepID=A0A0C3QKZ2_9AGAM|nr:hypothetical protein M407DRAFT_17844 [Tulasnella calospora MUT 4182]
MIEARVGRHQEAIQLGIARAQADPGGTLGPWFMALICYTFLMGILTVQVTRYFSTYGIESWGLFTSVVLSMILVTTQWTIAISGGWVFLIMHYGNWELIAAAPWQAWITPMINPVTEFVSQLFFAHRCYKLYGRNKFIFGGLLFGMLSSAVMSILFGVALAIDPYDFTLGKTFAIPSTTLSLATDFSITGLTLWKLSRQGGVTFSPQTNDGLQRLRSITLEAAVPPTVFTFLNMCCYVAMHGQNLIFAFFGILTPSLYVCSLMFVLNSFEFSPVSGTRTGNTDMCNTGTVLSTTTVPDFAPDPPIMFATGQSGAVNKRRGPRRDADSFVESESELQVDLDRWGDDPPSPHSKAPKPMDVEQTC